MKKIIMPLASLTMLAAFAGTPAVADPQSSSHVDTLSAAVNSSAVNVNGTATFVGGPATVVSDAGDGLVVDVTGGSISRVSPSSNTLTFSYDISAPTTDFPNLVYLWPIAVDGTDSGYFLMGGRIGVGNVNPTFILAQTGSGGFSTRATLTGSLTATKISFNLNMNLIGASGGKVLSQGAGSTAEVRTGVAGAGYCCTTADQLDAMAIEDYTIPAATVQLGIASAGTAPESVPLTSSATVNASTGAFSGSVLRPAQAGTYVVVAKACYTATSCGLSSTTITV